MDLHCPAVVLCLAPDDAVPESAGGHRVVAAYTYADAGVTGGGAVPVERAPGGKFWQVIGKIADAHRGAAAILFAEVGELDPRDLRGVALSVDSAGPVRISADEPVDNGY